MASPTDQPVLSLKNVTKTFGDFKAVDDADIEVMPGEIYGFLGPNGAGKSTTIRLILDILRPDSGTITILGRSSRNVRESHRDLGYMSGEIILDTDLTGQQYLDFINALHGDKHHHTVELLSGMLDVDLSKKIGDYSRGNRQKIALVAAILYQPKLLILDEPTTGFDPLVQETFAELIKAYVGNGGTVFMSSHILAEVQHLCDRVAFIKDGKIVTVRTVQDLLDSTAKRITVTASEADIKKIAKSHDTLAGLSLVESKPERLTFTYAGPPAALLHYFAPFKLDDITIREPELDEIFGQYYEKAPEKEVERA